VRIIATVIFLFGSALYAGSLRAQTRFPEGALSNPAAYHAVFESSLPVQEIEIYKTKEKEQTIVLENGYASYVFQNDDWPPQGDSVVPTSVNIIFTKYPKERSFWLTDYHWLLAKRLEALFALDPRFNSKAVTFSITLQTACDNEFEAMQLFHGMELGFRPVTDHETDGEEPEASSEEQHLTPTPPTDRNRIVVKKIKRFMVQQRYMMDSTVFNAFEHHPEWKNALVVIDWTGSMYGHGSEVILWHALHEEESGIDHVALFNDGDKKKTKKKIPGYTGGVYTADASPVARPLKLFNKVKNKGNGGDSPENDIEALVTGINAFPDAKEVILVADNRSCIRDFLMLQCLDRPIRIILTDTRKGINHQYINLAWKTRGSLHWENGELYDVESAIGSDSLTIQGEKYILSPDGWITPANRLGPGYGFCTRYYKAPRRRQKQKRRKEPKCYFTE